METQCGSDMVSFSNCDNLSKVEITIHLAAIHKSCPIGTYGR